MDVVARKSDTTLVTSENGHVIRLGDVEKEREIERRMRELGLWERKKELERQVHKALDAQITETDGLTRSLRACRRSRDRASVQDIRNIIQQEVVRDCYGQLIAYRVQVLMGHFTHDVTHSCDVSEPHVIVITASTPPSDPHQLKKEIRLDLPPELDMTRLLISYMAGVVKISVPYKPQSLRQCRAESELERSVPGASSSVSSIYSLQKRFYEEQERLEKNMKQSGQLQQDDSQSQQQQLQAQNEQLEEQLQQNEYQLEQLQLQQQKQQEEQQEEQQEVQQEKQQEVQQEKQQEQQQLNDFRQRRQEQTKCQQERQALDRNIMDKCKIKEDELILHQQQRQQPIEQQLQRTQQQLHIQAEKQSEELSNQELNYSTNNSDAELPWMRDSGYVSNSYTDSIDPHTSNRVASSRSLSDDVFLVEDRNISQIDTFASNPSRQASHLSKQHLSTELLQQQTRNEECVEPIKQRLEESFNISRNYGPSEPYRHRVSPNKLVASNSQQLEMKHDLSYNISINPIDKNMGNISLQHPNSKETSTSEVTTEEVKTNSNVAHSSNVSPLVIDIPPDDIGVADCVFSPNQGSFREFKKETSCAHSADSGINLASELDQYSGVSFDFESKKEEGRLAAEGEIVSSAVTDDPNFFHSTSLELHKSDIFETTGSEQSKIQHHQSNNFQAKQFQSDSLITNYSAPIDLDILNENGEVDEKHWMKGRSNTQQSTPLHDRTLANERRSQSGKDDTSGSTSATKSASKQRASFDSSDRFVGKNSSLVGKNNLANNDAMTNSRIDTKLKQTVPDSILQDYFDSSLDDQLLSPGVRSDPDGSTVTMTQAVEINDNYRPENYKNISRGLNNKIYSPEHEPSVSERMEYWKKKSDNVALGKNKDTTRQSNPADTNSYANNRLSAVAMKPYIQENVFTDAGSHTRSADEKSGRLMSPGQKREGDTDRVYIMWDRNNENMKNISASGEKVNISHAAENEQNGKKSPATEDACECPTVSVKKLREQYVKRISTNRDRLQRDASDGSITDGLSRDRSNPSEVGSRDRLCQDGTARRSARLSSDPLTTLPEKRTVNGDVKDEKTDINVEYNDEAVTVSSRRDDAHKVAFVGDKSIDHSREITIFRNREKQQRQVGSPRPLTDNTSWDRAGEGRESFTGVLQDIRSDYVRNLSHVTNNGNGNAMSNSDDISKSFITNSNDRPINQLELNGNNANENSNTKSSMTRIVYSNSNTNSNSKHSNTACTTEIRNSNGDIIYTNTGSHSDITRNSISCCSDNKLANDGHSDATEVNKLIESEISTGPNDRICRSSCYTDAIISPWSVLNPSNTPVGQDTCDSTVQKYVGLCEKPTEAENSELALSNVSIVERGDGVNDKDNEDHDKAKGKKQQKYKVKLLDELLDSLDESFI